VGPNFEKKVDPKSRKQRGHKIWKKRIQNLKNKVDPKFEKTIGPEFAKLGTTFFPRSWAHFCFSKSGHSPHIGVTFEKKNWAHFLFQT